jgi:hypothetical protein
MNISGVFKYLGYMTRDNEASVTARSGVSSEADSCEIFWFL